MVQEMWSKITDLPTLVQGVLASAIFWAVLKIASYLYQMGKKVSVQTRETAVASQRYKDYIWLLLRYTSSVNRKLRLLWVVQSRIARAICVAAVFGFAGAAISRYSFMAGAFFGSSLAWFAYAIWWLTPPSVPRGTDPLDYLRALDRQLFPNSTPFTDEEIGGRTL